MQGPVSLVAASASPSMTAIRGSIAGRTFDKATGEALTGVSIRARSLQGEELFAVATDQAGRYQIPDVPASVFAFSLTHDGTEYPVAEKLDARVARTFLVETCFALDVGKRAAAITPDCVSGFVPEARVATIGPQRFLLPFSEPQQTELAADLGDQGPGIQHDALVCLPNDHHPIVQAEIHPGEMVQTSRVYFRAEQYPDFYYVEMTSIGDDFEAVLPVPGADTKRVIYYVEAVDPYFDSLQTPEYDPEVIDGETCKRRDPGAYWQDGTQSIIIGATVPGAAAVPPGFQALGITGFISSAGIVTVAAAGVGGAGIGTTGLILIVAGGVVIGTAVGVITTGEVEASPPNQ